MTALEDGQVVQDKSSDYTPVVLFKSRPKLGKVPRGNSFVVRSKTQTLIADAEARDESSRLGDYAVSKPYAKTQTMQIYRAKKQSENQTPEIS